MRLLATILCVGISSLGSAPSLDAQTRDVPSITQQAARQLVQRALRAAEERGWQVSVAVVDASGMMLAFDRTDDSHGASTDFSLAKARTSARFRRPTKALADAVAAGRVGLAGPSEYLMLEGGLPIVVSGRVVGAIGVSGMTGEQDAQVATAALAGLSR